MPPFIDLTSQKFGRLTVLNRAENNKFNQVCWKCQCACGNIAIVPSQPLRKKEATSCGCLQKENLIKRITTHNMSHSPEYAVWGRMVQRCVNPKNKRFKHYGGRGIKVCKEWRDSFLAFYEHVGQRPYKKASIDRINNEGDYCPGNVRWTDIVTQNNNNRRNYYITIKGITRTIAQWAKTIGIKEGTLWHRINVLRWPPEKAIFKKVNHKKFKLITVNGVTKTVTQWSKISGIYPHMITRRLRRGWTPENAVFSKPVTT